MCQPNTLHSPAENLLTHILAILGEYQRMRLGQDPWARGYMMGLKAALEAGTVYGLWDQEDERKTNVRLSEIPR